MLFLLYSLISQIYAESLRKTVIKTGYPEDKENISWTPKDYVKWVFFCFKEKDNAEIEKEEEARINKEKEEENGYLA